MRKLFRLMIGAFVVCLASAPAAKAGSVALTVSSSTPSTTTFTISGTYASNVPTFSFNGVNVSAPNGTYSMSFTLNTQADTNSGFVADAADGLFDVNATLSFSLNGETPMSFGVPFLVEFDTTTMGNFGGLIFCFDDSGSCSSNTDWDIIGQQLFSGDLSNPDTVNFLNLPKGAEVNQVMSGFEISGQGPFQFGATPEPSSIFLLGTGLLGLGFAVRRKLRLV